MSNDSVKKTFKISDCCGMAMAGAAEFGATVLEKFLAQLRKIQAGGPLLETRQVMGPEGPQLQRVEVPAERRPDANSFSFQTDLLYQHFMEYFTRYFPNPVPIPGMPQQNVPPLSIIVGGYNTVEGRKAPTILYMDSRDYFAPATSTRGFHCAGIPVLADYFFNRFHARTVSSDETSALAAFVLDETRRQDGRVGGKIQLSQIGSDGTFKEFSDEEIVEMLKSQETIVKRFREVLFAGLLARAEEGSS